MKSYLFTSITIVALFFSHLSLAQIQWGVRAGMNMTNSEFLQADGSSRNTDPVARIQLGVTMDVPVSHQVYIQPSLMYQGKGFKGTEVWPVVTGDDSELNVNLSYLVIPVQLVFKPQLSENGRLLVGVGPYLGYGLGGKWQSESDLLYDDMMLAQQEGDVSFTSDGSVGDMGVYNYGKPWDYGVGFLLGYEFKQQYSLQVNSDFGLANLQYEYGDFDTGEKLKNSAIGFSLGYKF
ncbi:outer membrane beta-barrel protein [Algoriphagus vanfongensis]|uniref:outer membrane beta-barrel protein n=1 Tax=Algoriphagus vanfongensis TaxID=426371 RepID=UPI00041EC8E5|nr:outer membrane beta-barrel protein [Algoriphagus vanfongensis]